MKRWIVLFFSVLFLLSGCKRVEPYVYYNGHNRYWAYSVPSEIRFRYRRAADDEGTLYVCEEGNLYTVVKEEKTLLLEGGEPVSAYDNVYWYRDRLYFCDTENGYGFWEYDLSSGVFRELGMVWPEAYADHYQWLGNIWMITGDRLYVQNGWGTGSYDLITGEKRFYEILDQDLICDGTYLYMVWPARVWQIHLETGWISQLDVSFVTEEKKRTIHGMYLDGTGDVWYVTGNWETGEKRLWHGTTDDSAPCEEIPLVWNGNRIRPDTVIGEYNRDLYFTAGVDVFKWESSGDSVEWVCEVPDGERIFILGNGLYSTADRLGDDITAVVPDLSAE